MNKMLSAQECVSKAMSGFRKLQEDCKDLGDATIISTPRFTTRFKGKTKTKTPVEIIVPINTISKTKKYRSFNMHFDLKTGSMKLGRIGGTGK